MHTVFENGNLDEVFFWKRQFVTKCKCRNWFALLCVRQCAFWSDFDTLQNDVWQ